jgi:hypothetical protein
MPQETPKNRKQSANPYRTISASERRARRNAREGGRVRVPDGDEMSVRSQPPPQRTAAALPQDVVNELLANPTKVVTEDELRNAYSYVLADLRNMALLSLALVVLLVVLALVLPRF